MNVNMDLVDALRAAADSLASAMTAAEEAEREQKGQEAKFLEDSKPIREKMAALGKELDAMEEASKTARAASYKADQEMYQARRKAELAHINKILFSGETIKGADLTFLSNMLDTNGDVKLREVKTAHKGCTIYAFNEQSTSCGCSWKPEHNWYMAFRDNKLVSFLHVDLAQHVGATTYTQAYGCKLLMTDEKYRKEVRKSYYREGLSFKEWNNPDIVEFTGINQDNIQKVKSIKTPGEQYGSVSELCSCFRGMERDKFH